MIKSRQLLEQLAVLELSLCAHTRVCVCVCVCACVRACVCACVCVRVHRKGLNGCHQFSQSLTSYMFSLVNRSHIIRSACSKTPCYNLSRIDYCQHSLLQTMHSVWLLCVWATCLVIVQEIWSLLV